MIKISFQNLCTLECDNLQEVHQRIVVLLIQQNAEIITDTDLNIEFKRPKKTWGQYNSQLGYPDGGNFTIHKENCQSLRVQYISYINLTEDLLFTILLAVLGYFLHWILAFVALLFLLFNLFLMKKIRLSNEDLMKSIMKEKCKLD